MNPSHPRTSPFLSDPLLALSFSLTSPPRGTLHSSAQLSLPNPLHPPSSPHLDLFTSISLLSFLNMKTSSWTMLDRPLRQVSSDLNPSPFWLLPKVFYHGKLSWTLRFPVPPPDTSGSARRFSSTVTFQQGPVLFNSPFLRLPDLSVLCPPRIDSYETPSPPEPAVQDWLNNRAPRLIPSRHRTYIASSSWAC